MCDWKKSYLAIFIYWWCKVHASKYQDAMAICRWAGYPDLFLTFTCNPAWPEISRFCYKYNVVAANRPDILIRIFKIKLRALMKVLSEGHIFGNLQVCSSDHDFHIVFIFKLFKDFFCLMCSCIYNRVSKKGFTTCPYSIVS